jgi:hypothetical protein
MEVQVWHVSLTNDAVLLLSNNHVVGEQSILIFIIIIKQATR